MTSKERPLLDEFQSEIDAKYVPFFERFSRRMVLPYWTVWIILGELAFLVHYLIGQARGVNILEDATWMVGAMIGITLVLVDRGTQRMRKSVVRMRPLVDTDLDTYKEFVIRQMEWVFSDRRFFVSGLIAGIANTIVSLTYGSWYADSVMTVSLHAMHFLLGFVCGLAIWGGICVVRVLRHTSRNDLRLDVDAEDRCWGTGFLGRKVLADSLSFFLVGLFIATYILISPWANRESETVKFLIFAWILFPYLNALAVFILPVVHIHKAIAREKQNRLDDLAERRHRLRKEIEDLESEKDAALLQHRGRLIEVYTDACNERGRISEMNLGPYNMKQIGKFVLTLIIPAAVFFWENRDTIRGLFALDG